MHIAIISILNSVPLHLMLNRAYFIRRCLRQGSQLILGHGRLAVEHRVYVMKYVRVLKLLSHECPCTSCSHLKNSSKHDFSSQYSTKHIIRNKVLRGKYHQYWNQNCSINFAPGHGSDIHKSWALDGS
jgi:hypothetical protein